MDHSPFRGQQHMAKVRHTGIIRIRLCLLGIGTLRLWTERSRIPGFEDQNERKFMIAQLPAVCISEWALHVLRVMGDEGERNDINRRKSRRC